jgi:tetratricopeptide (TPR) repeat protein
LLPGNLLCLRCHNGSYPKSPVIDLAKHTFHKADSTGSQCVNCHMPQTTYMQRHGRHDHGFTIPDPLLTKEFAIPNACNRCHQDKDTDWSLQAVNKWYGPKMDRPYRKRSRLMASARRGDDVAREQLLQFLKTDESGFWKGVAANLLERWANEPRVESALIELMKHPDPLTRANAVQTLGTIASQPGSGESVRNALRDALSDPVRSVRYPAAWALSSTLDPESKNGRELFHTLYFNADQPMGQVQKGSFEIARRNIAGAVPFYEKAVAWDAGSAPIRQELATVLSMAGRPEGAVKQMQEAVRLEPRNADYRYRLALALNEAGQPDGAARELETTVALNPRHARAWYNLGLTRNQRGQTDKAIEALLRGESADSSDPEIPYALATILLRTGQQNEARAAAERALRIAPNYEAARQLLGTLKAGN